MPYYLVNQLILIEVKDRFWTRNRRRSLTSGQCFLLAFLTHLRFGHTHQMRPTNENIVFSSKLSRVPLLRFFDLCTVRQQSFNK